VPSLEFFTGINIKSEQKLKVFEIAITILKKHFELVPMSNFSKRISAETKSILIKTDESTEQKSILQNSSV
jgi:hypothetical protein